MLPLCASCAHDVTNARRRSSPILPSLPDRCTPSLFAFSGQFSTQHIDFMLVQFPIEKYSCEREKFPARWAHFMGTLFPRSSVFCHPGFTPQKLDVEKLKLSQNPISPSPAPMSYPLSPSTPWYFFSFSFLSATI